MLQTLRIFVLLFFAINVHAQRVSGIWSGKIIRQNDTLYAHQNLEIQIDQEGKRLMGITYSFNDSTQYVRMNMQGTINKKKDEVVINELIRGGYFKLPTHFYPCVKNFELKYSRIGNDQYLIGLWNGWNALDDTICFPNQILTVYLKKVRKSEFGIESFVKKEIDAYNKSIYEAIINKKDSMLNASGLKVSLNNKSNEGIISKSKDPIIPEPAEKTDDKGLFTAREATITTLITVPEQKVILELYDNGEIDDDTVSVFINKLPIITKQRLSAKPMVYEFVIGKALEPFEILMQAENLGSIPPNTGKMIIKAGKLRREIDLSSDFKKSAAILIQYEKH